MRKITFFKTMLVAIALVIGSVSTWGQTTINFDNAANWVQDGTTSFTSYANHSYTELGVTVQGTNVIRNGTAAQDGFAGALGTYSFRVGNTATSKVLITIAAGGLSNFSIKVRRWDNSPMPDYTVKYSTDAGANWTGITNINGTLLTTSDFFIFNSGTINSTANSIQIEIKNTGTTERIMLDDFTWTGYTGGGTPIVSTPTLTPSSGSYTTAQSIAITSSTVGASIYYTTNGNDPTELSTLYTEPISISTTTTIKAKAYKSGYDASSTATATYTFPTSVATIADLRAATTPGFYKLTGEVVLTLKSTTRNAKYIQDATGAVLIDDNFGIITTAYNVGDGITGIIGTTALYNNMLQFTPVADPGVATSTGNTVTPAIVALADLINNQGKLVKVLSATITGTGNFVASTGYNLNGSASTVIRTQYADLDYVGQAIPTTAQDITGVVLVYGTTAQLVPRSLSDLTPSLGTGLTPIKNTNIYASNGNIVLSASANQTVDIFNAVGQKLLSHKAVEGINTIPASTKGLVLVKIGNQISKVIL